MDFIVTGLPQAAALASVALIGYVFGRRRIHGFSPVMQSEREIARAQAVAKQLEHISSTVRAELTRHDVDVKRFKERIRRMANREEKLTWQELCSEAERILQPTLQLTTRISNAYDALQLQTSHLRTFTEVRTDPLTGLCNRRALEESLSGEIARRDRHDEYFSVAIIDIDHFKKINDSLGHLTGDRIIKLVASQLDEEARQADVVARFGGEEFMIVMPKTDLDGATVAAERLRQKIQLNCRQITQVTVSVGVATVTAEDDAESVMTRADEALYRAKDDGRNCVRRHTGTEIGLLENLLELAATD